MAGNPPVYEHQVDAERTPEEDNGTNAIPPVDVFTEDIFTSLDMSTTAAAADTTLDSSKSTQKRIAVYTEKFESV